MKETKERGKNKIITILPRYNLFFKIFVSAKYHIFFIMGLNKNIITKRGSKINDGENSKRTKLLREKKTHKAR